MSYFLLFILISLNFFSLQFKKKSVGVIVLSILIFSILLGGNNNNPDYWAYEENYRLVQNDNSYFGFDFLWGPFMKIGGYLGLSYNEFLLTASLIAYSFLFYFLFSRMDYRIHKVLLLYCVYSFFIDVVQVANFFANVLAVFALFMIMDYKESKDKSKLVLFMIITMCSMGFHLSSSILLPILFFKKTYKVKYLVLFSIAFGIIDTSLSHIFIDKIMALLPVGNAYAALKDYGSNIGSGFGFIIYTFILLLLLWVVKRNCCDVIKQKLLLEQTIPDRLMLDCKDVIFYIRYILALTPIFAISTITYVRCLRVVMIYYGLILPLIGMNKKMRFVNDFIILSVYFYFFQTDVGTEVFLEVMNNNYLFE